LLPLRPALAALLGGWIAPQLARVRGQPRQVGIPRNVHMAIGMLVLGGTAGMLALRTGVGGFGTSQLDWSYWWRGYIESHFGIALAFVVGIGVGMEAIASGLWQRRIELAGAALAATLGWALAISVAAASVVRGEGATVQPLAQAILAQLRPEEPLAFFDTDDRDRLSLLFHLRRQVPVVEPESAQAPCTPPRRGLYLISEARWAERPCFHPPDWEEILRGGPPVSWQRSQWLVVARYAGAAAQGAPS
jgi:hypothetical protein